MENGLVKCFNCGTEHFEVCHLRSIQDFPIETTMAVVDSLENLIALCPNCHWEYDQGLLTL